MPKQQLVDYIEVLVTDTKIRVHNKTIDKFKDSALEVYFSGRQSVEHVKGLPYLNRDPEAF